MGPLLLLGLAAQQAKWLAARQATVSQNLANVNTPAYRAQDVRPFGEVLQRVGAELATTNPAHIAADPASPVNASLQASDSSDATVSGNSVSLEGELMKAGDVNRGYALNSGIVKAFHRMLLASVKSGA